MIALANWLRACFCALICLLSASAFAQAGTCTKTGSICAQGPETRTISGVPVFRDCWAYQDKFSCVEPTGTNYCTPFITGANSANCSQTGSVCVENSATGACTKYENRYTCGDDPNVAESAPNLLRLADTLKVIKDELNETQCQVLSANSACTKTGRVCKQGPETRAIGGLDVFKDCWEYEDTYQCSASNYVNFCQPLTVNPSCRVISDTCAQTNAQGTCASRLKTYDCGVTIDNPQIILLNSSYTVASETLDTSLCNGADTSANCTLASETCVEGPETRMINGSPVYRDCWRYDRQYACAGTNLSSDCQALVTQGCIETANICNDLLPGGQCGVRQRTFACQFTPPSSTQVTNCGGQTFCMQGNCFDTSHTPDPDFLKATAVMEAGRQGGNYLDQTKFTLFSGTADICSKTLGGLGNCCKVNANGGTSNSTAAEQAGAVLKIGSEIYKAGSAYAYDSLSLSPLSVLTTLGKGVASFAAGKTDSLIASTNFSFYGASFSFSSTAGLQFVAFDPVSFAIQVAIQVLTEIVTCDQPEKMLALKRGQNLCTFVGTWCSSRVLGACVKHSQSYCCYNSRLARIIAEQGRTQLGKNYGPPTSPTCDGFTEAEVDALDFSRMDLSEFINEITAKMPNETFRFDKSLELVQRRVQNYMTNGQQNVPPPVYTGPPPGP